MMLIRRMVLKVFAIIHENKHAYRGVTAIIDLGYTVVSLVSRPSPKMAEGGSRFEGKLHFSRS